jgi:alkyldihydroxyacetonephosphate synthase
MLMKTDFIPPWIDFAPLPGSYRSIFKWGSPDQFKHPSGRLYAELKESLGMSDSDFTEIKRSGNNQVVCRPASRLGQKHFAALAKIAGKNNISQNDFDRVKYSCGMTFEEAMMLRAGKTGSLADVIIHPRNKNDVEKIIAYCSRNKISVSVYGGGSSVNFGVRPVKGGVSLVMKTHMKRIIGLSDEDQTVTVEAGILGPELESALNMAPDLFGAGKRYTCGHFPQSFEYSSVGGWVSALGSGQSSSYYGDARDLVIAQEYVTPAGLISIPGYPASAAGPDLNEIMMGSEGTFGVLTSVTLKIFRYEPKNRRRFSFIFPSWENAVGASREISQAEFGFPAVFRISDHEETRFVLKLYGVDSAAFDLFLKARGMKRGKICLCLGYAEGEKAFAKNIWRKIKSISRNFGGVYLTGYPAKMWEHGRYKDPYLREDLGDFGIAIDTLETSVMWSGLSDVYEKVRGYIKARPNTICLTHCSHFYPQGTNLYFIFIAKIGELAEYVKFQRGIIDAVAKSGGSLSHHHGIGKMIAPWMEKHYGSNYMNVLRALKSHFDPNGIMNPGGQLGLDNFGVKKQR